MLDAHREVVGDTFLEFLQEPGGLFRGERVVHDDVRGQSGEVRGDLGGVQVVHGDHLWELEDVSAYLRQVKAGRGGFEQDAAGCAEQDEGARDDQESDQDAGDRVCLVPAEGGDQDGADDDADGAKCVIEDLEERGAHVQVACATAHQHQQRRDVRDQADDPEEQQAARRDLGRLK